MKRILVLCITVVMIIASAGCGQTSKPVETSTMTESPASEAPKSGIVRGGTLVVAKTANMQTMDVVQNNYLSNDGFVLCNIYELLITMDEDGNFAPGLATEWKYSDDGLSLTLKLRQGVKFSDGEPFNAEAVKVNLDWATNPEAKAAYYPTTLNLIKNVEVVDDYTVRINLTEPDGALLNTLTYTAGLMISPAKIKDKSYITYPVGTGPFMLKEHVEGSHTTLVRNPNYYKLGEDGKPLPYLDEIIFRYMADDAVKTANLLSGDVDGVDIHSSTNSVLTAKSNDNMNTYLSPMTTDFFVSFNLNDPQLSDVRVRQAVGYAINPDEIIEAVFEGTAVKSAFLAPEGGTWFYSDYTPYSYNPDKAKELLKEAGYENGITIKLYSISREPDNTIVQLLQEQFKASNINLEIVALERNAWVDLIRVQFGGEMGLGQGNYVGHDPSQVYDTCLYNTKRENTTKFSNMINQIRRETDIEKRKSMLQQYQKEILDEAIILYICEKQNFSSYNKKVHGFKYFSLAAGDYSAVWKEK